MLYCKSNFQMAEDEETSFIPIVSTRIISEGNFMLLNLLLRARLGWVQRYVYDASRGVSSLL